MNTLQYNEIMLYKAIDEWNSSNSTATLLYGIFYLLAYMIYFKTNDIPLVRTVGTYIFIFYDRTYLDNGIKFCVTHATVVNILKRFIQSRKYLTRHPYVLTLTSFTNIILLWFRIDLAIKIKSTDRRTFLGQTHRYYTKRIINGVSNKCAGKQ